MKKRITNRYYFSVEGECEKLYLQRLDNIIKGENPPFNVAFSVKVEKHPLKYIKALLITEKNVFKDLENFICVRCSKFSFLLEDQVKEVLC